jgi:hypothetical protein
MIYCFISYPLLAFLKCFIALKFIPLKVDMVANTCKYSQLFGRRRLGGEASPGKI